MSKKKRFFLCLQDEFSTSNSQYENSTKQENYAKVSTFVYKQRYDVSTCINHELYQVHSLFHQHPGFLRSPTADLTEDQAGLVIGN